MRCPYCSMMPSAVTRTLRPLDEGMEAGDIKQRLRKCRSCQRNFITFEIHENTFRELRGEDVSKSPTAVTARLTRQPLLMEGANKRTNKPVTLARAKTKGAAK